MARFQTSGRYVEVTGLLGFVGTFGHKTVWNIDGRTFTVCKLSNPWVVRNLKQFEYQHIKVLAKIDDANKLLSVRVK